MNRSPIEFMVVRLLGVLALALGPVLFVHQASGQDPTDPSGETETGPAISYAEAMRDVEADLREALDQLAAQRKKIAEERPQLARETNEIAAEVREKRSKAELARQERDALNHELQELAQSVTVWQNESTYIQSLLADFRRQFEANISIAEADSLRADLLAAEKDGDDGLNAMLDLAERSVSRLPTLRGVRTLPGEALDEDGISKSGMFIEAGPVSWFLSDDGESAGLVNLTANLKPEVLPKNADPSAIKKLAEGGGGSPQFDPTLGTAVALDEVEGTLLDHIRKGGFWIYPILLLALIATVAAVAKWFQLMGIRSIGADVIRKVVDAVNRGEEKKANEALESVKHPASKVLARGVEMRGRSPEDIEEALYEEYLEAQPALQRGLPFIAIAAATAPLLGLLGTVTGMIHTFKLINIFGTGDAKSLSSGISEALVTTEFGLVVAIPALILHALLSRKVQGIKAGTEMASLAFINGLKKGGQSS